MTRLTRLVTVIGGLALLSAPAYPQEGARRFEPPPAGPGAPGGPGRMGFARGPIPPPRVGPIPGWESSAFQKSVDLGARGTLDVSNSPGEIRVRGTDGNVVRITATKRVKESNRDAARALMPNIVIRVTERGGGIEVFTELPSGKNPPILVDYDIFVPMSASVSLKSTGSIFVSNLKGELRAEAFAGHMVLSSVSRVRRAKTYGGDLAITGAEGEEVTADVGGALNMKNVRARTVETRTIAGPSTAIDVECERCSLTSVSGDIDFVGALRRNARYDITTNSGNIRLVPDGIVGFDLEATTGGTLRSDYALKPTAPTSPASGGRFLRGAYGDGSAILSLKSFTGSVTVAKQAITSGGR